MSSPDRRRNAGRHKDDGQAGETRPAALKRPRKRRRPIRPSNLVPLGICAAGAALALSAPQVISLASSRSDSGALAPAEIAAEVVADTYVSSTAAGGDAKPNGASDRLTAASATTGTKIAFLKLRLSADAWAQVRRGARVKLTLTRDRHPLSGTVVARAVTSTQWSESALTWSRRPALGIEVSRAVLSPASVTATLDVTGAIRRAGTSSIALVSQGKAVQRFQSRESGAAGPAVVVEPPSATTETPSATTDPPPVPTDPVPGSSGTPPARSCPRSAKLVPRCGVLFGVAPGALTSMPRDQALTTFEQQSGRSMDVYRAYHTNGQLFPDATELKIAAARPGLALMLTWKPDTAAKWSAVAAGGDDQRIDALAAHMRRVYPTKPFFLSVWHEPENDVNATAGSGRTATDYRNMYRHVVQRLRIDGVTNLVTVVNYMGYPEWSTKPWFDDLYPGDDVVDWIAQDPYASAATSGYLATDFKGTVNRSQGSYPGFYSWAAAEHPGKPLMLGEWGVFESAANPNGKPAYYTSVQSQLGQFPELKAILYFDSPNAPKGDTKIDTTEAAQTAFRKLANSTEVTGK